MELIRCVVEASVDCWVELNSWELVDWLDSEIVDGASELVIFCDVDDGTVVVSRDDNEVIGAVELVVDVDCSCVEPAIDVLVASVTEVDGVSVAIAVDRVTVVAVEEPAIVVAAGEVLGEEDAYSCVLPEAEVEVADVVVCLAAVVPTAVLDSVLLVLSDDATDENVTDVDSLVEIELDPDDSEYEVVGVLSVEPLKVA